jgi:hypothetical protein
MTFRHSHHPIPGYHAVDVVPHLHPFYGHHAGDILTLSQFYSWPSGRLCSGTLTILFMYIMQVTLWQTQYHTHGHHRWRSCTLTILLRRIRRWFYCTLTILLMTLMLLMFWHTHYPTVLMAIMLVMFSHTHHPTYGQHAGDVLSHLPRYSNSVVHRCCSLTLALS